VQSAILKDLTPRNRLNPPGSRVGSGTRVPPPKENVALRQQRARISHQLSIIII
jgi:hypothetical protein